MPKATLVIIYNHHYPSNIERLNLIYGVRFKSIYHVIPFYDGERSDVIPVYENSFQFQGYIAQASSIINKDDSDHFLFIADDMIINPKINESSYAEIFGVNSSANFIPELLQLGEIENYWSRLSEACAWGLKAPGVESASQLPSFEEAMQIFKEFGWGPQLINSSAIFQKDRFWATLLRGLLRGKIRLSLVGTLLRIKIFNRGDYKVLQRKVHLHYPLVGGYSDIVLISKQDLPKFARYCGVFAASRLHVELAIPSSLVFATRNIVTEKDISRSGRAYWGDEVKEFDVYNGNLDTLLENFPDEKLYIHPIKLSEWS